MGRLLHYVPLRSLFSFAMNARYRIDQQQRIGVVTCFDVLTIETFEIGMERLTRDPLWQSEFGELWDCTEATDLRIGPSDLQRMAEIDHAYSDVVSATAMVMPSFAARSLAQSYFSLFPLGRPARVFSKVEEARVWLVDTIANIAGPTNA